MNTRLRTLLFTLLTAFALAGCPTISPKAPSGILEQIEAAELTAQQLAGVGVKRISVGGALSRLAFAAMRDAAIAMREGGRFHWVRDTMPTKDLKAIFSR